MNYTIATIASHSSLQILKGAKDEGFKTLCFVKKENLEFYSNYKFIDKFEILKDYKDLRKLEQKYKNKEIIIIPHGSFIAYLGEKFDKNTIFKYFGSKDILKVVSGFCLGSWS